MLSLLQRHLIYFPIKGREDELLREARRGGMRPWRDRSEQLIGWRSSSGDAVVVPENRLVAFHGNAGYALHRSYYVSVFQSMPQGAATWEIFLFEYPGYGARPGSPSEAKIMTAARAAIEELLRDDPRPVYLLGESLGSSFAARLAAEYPGKISGLLLVTPFTCMADVAASHYRFLPVRLMLSERLEVGQYLKSYPGPVAFLLAGRDEVIPPRLGSSLYESYQGRKRLWEQSGAGHNTLDLSAGAPWWEEVAGFLKAGRDGEKEL